MNKMPRKNVVFKSNKGGFIFSLSIIILMCILLVSANFNEKKSGLLRKNVSNWDFGSPLISKTFHQVTGLIITVVPTGNALDLSWDNLNETVPALLGYRIYRSTTAGFTTNSSNYLTNTTNNYYRDTSLTDGVMYYYRVSAVNVSLNEGPPSDETSEIPSDSVPPEKIIGVEVTIIPKGNALNLTWNDVGGDVIKYKVYREKSSGFIPNETENLQAEPTTNYYLDTGLDDGDTYYYRISAVDEVPLEGPYSEEAWKIPSDTEAPAKVTGLDISPVAEGNALLLSWDPCTALDFHHFNVYRSLAQGGPYTNIVNLTATSYTDTGLWDGTTYYYVITAVDEVPNEGPASDEATGTPHDSEAPAKVLGLQVTVISDNQLDLNWTQNTEPDLLNYCIYRSTTQGFTPSPLNNIANVTAPQNWFDDINVTVETTYYYRIKAMDTAFNIGEASDEQSGIINVIPPQKVRGVVVVNEGTGDILNISWHINPELDFDHYNVYRSTQANLTISPSNLVASPSANFYQDRGLIEYQTYYYRITAVDEANNEGNPSEIKNATPIDIKAPDPPLINAYYFPDFGRTIVLLITDPDYLTSDVKYYNVHRSSVSGFTPNNDTLIAGNYTKMEVKSNWYIDSDLPIGTYFYKVTALDEKYQESIPSNEATVPDTVPPGPPLNLTADPSGWTNENSFKVTWTNPTDLSGIVRAYYKLDSAPTSNIDGNYVDGKGIEQISDITVNSQGAHLIYVWLMDYTGNIEYSNHAKTILYFDKTPPSNFIIISPSEIVYNKTPGVICQIFVSGAGINLSSVQYAYSTTGSLTPTNWEPVDGVYLDAACTIPANDGATGKLYLKVSAVPFNQFALRRNTIRFRASDMANNYGVQSTAFIIRTANPITFIILLIIIVIGISTYAGKVIYSKRKQNRLHLKFLDEKENFNSYVEFRLADLDIILNDIDIIELNLDTLLRFQWMPHEHNLKYDKLYHYQVVKYYIGITELLTEMNDIIAGLDNQLREFNRKFQFLNSITQLSQQTIRIDEKIDSSIIALGHLIKTLRKKYSFHLNKSGPSLKVEFPLEEFDRKFAKIINKFREMYKVFVKEFDQLLISRQIRLIETRIDELDSIFKETAEWLTNAENWSKILPLPKNRGYKHLLKLKKEQYIALKDEFQLKIEKMRAELASSIVFAQNFIKWIYDTFKKRLKKFETIIYEDALRFISSEDTDFSDINQFLEEKFSYFNSLLEVDKIKIDEFYDSHKEFNLQGIYDEWTAFVEEIPSKLKRIRVGLDKFVQPLYRLFKLIKGITVLFYKESMAEIDKYLKPELSSAKQGEKFTPLNILFSQIVWKINRIDNEIKDWIDLLPFDLETPQFIILLREWNEVKEEVFVKLNTLSKEQKIYKCEIMHELLDPLNDEIWECSNCRAIACAEHLERWYHRKEVPECFKCGKTNTFINMKLSKYS
ncbi:MAG: hypothetical protein HWN65_20985 [Candidatus Helarchaeota archaeon]|nr:hypothetical protein [Candidatus Helarchaeota archaeon]